MFPDLSKLNEGQIFEFSSNLTTIIANKLSEAIKKILPVESQDTVDILREAFYNYDQDLAIDLAWETPIKENSLESFQKACPSLSIKDIVLPMKKRLKRFLLR